MATSAYTFYSAFQRGWRPYVNHPALACIIAIEYTRSTVSRFRDTGIFAVRPSIGVLHSPMDRNTHALFHFAAPNHAGRRLVNVASAEGLLGQSTQSAWAHQFLQAMRAARILLLILAQRLLQELKIPLDDRFFQANLDNSFDMLIRRCGVDVRKKRDLLLWRFG